MRTTLSSMALMLISCQAYDFEQVEPIFYRRFLVAKAVKSARPDVMLLIDKSGSMDIAIDRTDPRCSLCDQMSGSGCPAGCPTRISELKDAMPVFLESAKSQARFGLALFPKGPGPDSQCVATNAETLIEPLPENGPETPENLALWVAQNERIKAKIADIATGGGTPTAGSLDFVGMTPGLASPSPEGRKRVVILLTDGLPNCSTHPGVPKVDNDPYVVDSVKALADNGVSTIVIGFGSDTQGAAILDTMARAGGYPRSCADDANACGAGDVCRPDKTCNRGNYSASNATELKAVLEALRGIIDPDNNPCRVDLGKLDYENVVVTLDGQVLPESPTTWTKTAGHTITFAGASCARILDSTEGSKALIEVGVF